MMSGINTPRTPGKFQAWAAYDYASADIAGTALSGNGNLNTIAVGGDMLVTDKMLAGIQFAYTEYKGDFGNGGGDFKLREPMMTFYGGYGEGPWYLGATLGVGALDYDANRSIALGADHAHGDGHHHRLSHRRAPARRLLVQVPATGTTVRSPSSRTRTSSCASSARTAATARRSPTTSRRTTPSGRASAGRSTGDVQGFRPFARATWEYNFQNDTRQVTARSNTLAGSYVVPGFEQDDNWWLFDLGVSKEFGKVTGLPLRQRVCRQGRRRLLGGDGRHQGPVVTP